MSHSHPGRVSLYLLASLAVRFAHATILVAAICFIWIKSNDELTNSQSMLAPHILCALGSLG